MLPHTRTHTDDLFFIAYYNCYQTVMINSIMSIHPFSILNWVLFRIRGVCRSLSLMSPCERPPNHGQVPEYIAGPQRQTTMVNLKSPISLTCTSLDCGCKLEYLAKNPHEHWKNTPHRDPVGISTRAVTPHCCCNGKILSVPVGAFDLDILT